MQKLAKALMAAQAELQPIVKGSTNPHFKSKYATLEDCIAATRPILQKHGLVVSQATRYEGGGGVLLLVTTLTHVESGENRESHWPLIPAKANDPQALGSALTYARRYAHNTIIGAVTSDEDDDGNAAAGRDAKDTKKAPPKAPAQETKPANGEAPTIGEGKAVVWETARKLWPKAEEHKARIRALLEKHGVAATEKLPYPKDGVVAYVNELNETKRLEGEGKHAA